MEQTLLQAAVPVLTRIQPVGPQSGGVWVCASPPIPQCPSPTMEHLGEHDAGLIFFFLISIPDPVWGLLGVHFKVRERESRSWLIPWLDCMLYLVWYFPHLTHLFYDSWKQMNDSSACPASAIRGSGQKNDLITSPPHSILSCLPFTADFPLSA